jgi:hypothetical protein
VAGFIITCFVNFFRFEVDGPATSDAMDDCDDRDETLPASSSSSSCSSARRPTTGPGTAGTPRGMLKRRNRSPWDVNCNKNNPVYINSMNNGLN